MLVQKLVSRFVEAKDPSHYVNEHVHPKQPSGLRISILCLQIKRIMKLSERELIVFQVALKQRISNYQDKTFS